MLLGLEHREANDEEENDDLEPGGSRTTLDETLRHSCIGARLLLDGVDHLVVGILLGFTAVFTGVAAFRSRFAESKIYVA